MEAELKIQRRLLALKMERGPREGMQGRQPLEAEGKETCSLEPPKETSPADTLTLAQ